MRTHEAETALLVKLLQSGLYRSYVADNAVVREMWQHLFKGWQRIFYRHRIDDQFGTEHLYLFHLGEAVTVVGEAQSLSILLVNRHLVVETEQVDEETSHLTCSHNQYSHIFQVKSEE